MIEWQLMWQEYGDQFEVSTFPPPGNTRAFVGVGEFGMGVGWGGEFEPELSSLPSGLHLFYEKKSDHQIRHNFGPARGWG